MNWNQPMCDPCWIERNPNRPPVRLNGVQHEVCAHCGQQTTSGIYVRQDPRTVLFPSA